MKSETGWVIGYNLRGSSGMYQGFWFTRKDAIEYHVKAKGYNWIECKKKGDFVLKVEITPIIKNKG